MITPLNMLLSVPELPYSAATTPSVVAGVTQTSTAHWQAYLIPVNRAGSISKIWFYFTASNAGNIYSVSVESVDANGSPSGVLWAASTQKTGITGAAAATLMSVTLDAAATVAVGDFIAIVIKATTFVANWNIASFQDIGAGYFYPGIIRTTSSGATWAVNGDSPCCGLEYSDGEFARLPNVFPIYSAPSTVLTASSNPRIAGNRITPTVGLRVTAFWFWMDVDGADARIRLYGPDGTTVLRTVDFDKDIPIATGVATITVVPFATPVELAAGQSYYLMVEALGTSTTLYDLQTYSAAALDALNAGAVAKRATAASNAPASPSDFTISTDRMSLCGLIFDAIDIPTGGGAAETAHTFLA